MGRKLPMHIDQLGIAVPCGEQLSDMSDTGVKGTHFCSSCREHVHDLSRLTRQQAARVLRRGACVSAEYDEHGNVQFAPDPRPLRHVSRALALAAPLWMLGCKPGDAQPNDPPTEQARPEGSSAAEAECEELAELAPAAPPAGSSAAAPSGVKKPPVTNPHPRRLAGKPMPKNYP